MSIAAPPPALLKQSLLLQDDNANCCATAPQLVLTGFLQPPLRILDPLRIRNPKEEAERPYHSEATFVCVRFQKNAAQSPRRLFFSKSHPELMKIKE